jgi:hypothetical protein
VRLHEQRALQTRRHALFALDVSHRSDGRLSRIYRRRTGLPNQAFPTSLAESSRT